MNSHSPPHQLHAKITCDDYPVVEVGAGVTEPGLPDLIQGII